MKYLLYDLTRGKAALVVFGLGLLLILVGRWISPVDDLDLLSLDQMSPGKWFSLVGFALAILGAILGSIGVFVKKPRNARTQNKR